MRSLVQSIFAEEEDEDVSVNENQRDKPKKISFASCLDDSTQDDNPKPMIDKTKSSIYIEETSSEEEDD